MPPIKGRMISRMGRMGQQTGGEYAHLKLGIPKKKPKLHLKDAKSSSKMSSELRDEKLLKLRIPSSICRHLPSVKRFKGSKSYVDLTDDANSVQSEDSELSWEEKPISHQILGIKKSTRGFVTSKYFVRPMTEEKFSGMVWDIAFSPSGDVIVSCGEGILLCDYDLRIKSKLENIVLAGGVAFLSDDKIVAVCRNTDTVNIFTPTGKFLRSFPAGFSPMAIAATPDDKLIVCDPGSKCVRIYNVEGEELRSIGPQGDGYSLRWPLYASNVSDSSFLVSDCHSQSVLHFDVDGEFVGDMKLQTTGGNQVLRPHGLCVHQNNDVFVIDMATDTVEVFSETDSFIQTLIPQDEGHYLRPKIVRIGGHGNNFLAIGGLAGIVKLYEFVSEDELKVKPRKTPVKTPVKTPTKRSRISSVKKEYIKEEPDVVQERIILDDDDDEMNEPSAMEETESQEDEHTANGQNDEDEDISNTGEEFVVGELKIDEVQEDEVNMNGTALNTEDDPVLVEDSDDSSEDDDSEDEEEEDEDEATAVGVEEAKRKLDLSLVMEEDMPVQQTNGEDFEEVKNQDPIIVLDEED